MATQKNSASWDLQLGFNLAFKRLIVEGMSQNARNVALKNKCDINVRAGVLFEEEIIQKIVSHLIILVNNTVLQMPWIFIHCILCYKNNCPFYHNIS